MSTSALRKELAFKYIRGVGIEIGALHQPLEVPPNVRVNYVDRFDIKTILTHYPEIANTTIKDPDIIDDAQNLIKIEDDTFDFCIVNHVLEHMRNPLGAVVNWLRILKPGGILYLSVPDVNNSLDNGRPVTDITHLYNDSLTTNPDADFNHFLECAKYWNKLEDPHKIQQIAQENYLRDYSIHYHTFNQNSIKEFFHWMDSNNPGLFKIVEFKESEINGVHEYIYIIEKGTYSRKIFNFLQSSKNIQKKTDIDVIVPIYNAYQDLLKCLYSLLQYNEGYRIILINDQSTDEQVTKLVSQLKLFENNFLKVLTNEKNLGFVKTVNIGMKYSNHDVILLNSDTIVTANWSQKLKNYAYKNQKIATVTPLTNNGTICSVPDFLKENEIPEGFTIDDFADMIEKISFGNFIEIPTAVGFCMFIKRTALNQIGLFDEETFGRGYSEENDFSRRAIKYGYINALCDNTFIYHHGSSSFSLTKKELYDQNLKLVSERYPDYLSSVSQFCLSNPLNDIHINIKTRAMTWDCSKKDKRVLIILHSFGGGTAKYTMEMIDALKKKYIFYVLQISGNRLDLEEINNNQKINYTFTIPKCIDISVFHDPDYKNLLKRIISTFNINLIHVHHLCGHTLDIFEISKEDNIPLIMTIHDYYIACPSIYLVNNKGTYCNELNDIERCNICTEVMLRKSSGFIDRWRYNFETSLKTVSKFVANNNEVFSILRKVYNIQDERLVVIEPGHVSELINISKNRSIRELHDPICIAYIGVLDSSHKGMNLFYSLSRSKRLANKVKWKIVGTSEIHQTPGYYPDYNVHVYGKFKDYVDLSFALKDVDLIINPSLCETYGYTISEAWAVGLPVLTSNVGVPKIRIETTSGGWTMEVNNIIQAENKILEIINSPNDYYKKLESVSHIKLNEMKQFARDYMTIYDNISDIGSIHYSGFPLSPNEIFDSIQFEKPVDQFQKEDCYSQSNLFNPFTNTLPLHHRFIKCLQDNGIGYTLKRIIIFLKKLH